MTYPLFFWQQVSGLEEHMLLIVKRPRKAPYNDEPCRKIEHLLSRPLTVLAEELQNFVM